MGKGMLVLVLAIGYLIGNFSPSFIVGKLNKVDVRTKGSGNLGSTNTLRVLGVKAGVIVFIGDLAKGVAAALIGKFIMDGSLVGGLVCGLGVILGHNWPVFLGFKGGKGVAATGGVAIALTPLIGLIITIVGFGIVFLTRYVSLGSIIALTTYAILFIIFKDDTTAIIIACTISIIGIARHYSNIQRLLVGNENKIGNKSTS